VPAIEAVDLPIFMGKDAAEVVDNVGRFGPVARAFADATPEQVEKAKAAIATALKPHESAAGVVLPGACWLVRAKAA